MKYSFKLVFNFSVFLFYVLEFYNGNKEAHYKYSDVRGMFIMIVSLNFIMRSDNGKKLGEGGFSSVYIETHNNVTYACKKVKLSSMSFKIRYLVDELNSLRCLNHPNLVKCYGFAFRNTFTTCDIYLQYINGKTLDIAYGSKTQEEVLFYWIYQVAKAFIYLEQVGIVHRDIKPKNILVNNRGLVKIVDFGISKLLYNNFSNVVGSPSYIAPEIISQNAVYYKSDIWSFGISVYELTHKRTPFEDENQRTIFHKTCYDKIPVSRDCCSEDMARLIQRMLEKDPEKRISAQEILDLECLKSRREHFDRYYQQAVQNSLI